MKVLGVSSNYHDASAALIADGEVVAASAEERFTLQKHDPSFPLHASRFCLEAAGISADDLDLVAYHEEPEVKFSRTLVSSLVNYPRSRATFLKSMKEAATSVLWTRNEISKALDVDPARIVYVPHHFSHAAHAFLASPFRDSAVLTVDAVGEWTCTGMFVGRSGEKGATLEPTGVVPFPHSLGLAYSAFTAFLGFKVNDGECSTMALAAFGEPRFADQIRQIIRVAPDGSYQVDNSFFDFTRWDAIPVTRRFLEVFGQPHRFGNDYPFECLSDGAAAADTDSRRLADVARSLQLVLEEAMVGLAKKVRRDSGLPNLSLSGGVSLNCVANSKILAEGIFENVFVPPDPGDGGGAMGAALYVQMVVNGSRPRSVLSPYLGKGFAELELLEMLGKLKAADRISIDVRSDFDAVRGLVVPALEAGKIVGWFQGRFENGPRALGNRSLLCDPGNLETARRLSTRVKKRAAFRPYACAMLEEEASRLLSSVPACGTYPLKWMQSAAAVRPEHAQRLRAALHVDHCTRPQLCAEVDNPRFYALLSDYRRRTGVGALLNTSFNEHGMPIVASPADALLMFLRTDMDMLVLNNSLLSKKG